MTDMIRISDIRCHGTIGVWPWEQAVTQALRWDVELITDFDAAAKSDDLSDALDYHALTERIVALTQENDAKLLERLLTHVADTLFEEFGMTWLRLTLDKGRILKAAQSVALSTERGER